MVETDYGWWAIFPHQPLPLEQAWRVLINIGGGISTQVVLSTARHRDRLIAEFLVPSILGKEVAQAIQLALEQGLPEVPKVNS